MSRSAPKPEKRQVPDALDIAASKPAPAVTNKFDKKQSPEKIDDSYDDDFGSNDQIEEMLPEEAPEEPKLDEEFGGSQSMGLDPSVNTLAMDEYDHIEEVIRVD